MPQTYEVKKGDTLTAIAKKFGVSLNEISGYRSGDPNLIYPGEKLTIGGEASSQLRGLGGTLEKGGGVSPTGQERTLPTATDNLSIFQDLIKRVTERYARESTATGLQAGMETLGVKPEDISGRNLAGIVDFVKGESVPGMSDIYKSTVDLLENSKNQAEKQLSTLISTGGLLKINDEHLTKLSSMAGWDYESLLGIKASLEAELLKPKSFQTIEEAGRKVRIGFDDMGNIVSRTDIGEAEGGFGSLSGEEINALATDFAVELINENEGISDDGLFTIIKNDPTIKELKLTDSTIRGIIKDARARTKEPASSFDKAASKYAQWAEEQKKLGKDSDTVKLMLEGGMKEALGLPTSVDLPKQYTDLIDEILKAVYGGTFVTKRKQESLRQKFGIDQTSSSQ